MTTHLQPIMLNSGGCVVPQPPMYRPAVVQVVHHQNKTNLPPLLTCQMETKKKKPSTIWSFFLRILSCFNVFHFFHKSTKTQTIITTTDNDYNKSKLSSFPVNTYSEVNKHRPVYNTSSSYYRYQMDATAHKSKHSTHIRVDLFFITCFA